MTGTMVALVKERPEPGAVLREVPIPQIGDDEVLVKVDYASICGTDVHIYVWNEWAQNRIKTPHIMGHEFAGHVVETGRSVRGFSEGDFVSSETHIYCGHCYQCRTGHSEVCQNLQILGVDRAGAFAEYVAVPERVLWRNDDSVPAAWASIQEPMGNALDTVNSESVAGKTVLVTGAGPIGILAVGIAKAFGATQLFVSDLSDYRLGLATQMGADVVLNPTRDDVVARVLEGTQGVGVDVVLEMSGSEAALHQGLKALTAAGRMSMLGLPDRPVTINMTDDVIFKELRLYGVTGRKIFSTWQTVSRLLASRLVDPTPAITHNLKFEDWQQGMDAMVAGTSGKVVLQVSGR
ncbi:MAG: L-threonine 3-dehydrogenase [Candidatus Cryosericum sp.]|nr:L-threonine 3-dehydrogenase [Candidatus Cryosericum sp.]HPS69740.1 L-threonine 3-dehydrogenase [Candidatus Cryosericum sp.]